MTNKITRIPYGLNVYNNEEINAVLKTLKNSTQMGKAVNVFENKISKLFSKKYGLMVNSGSSALLLALKAVNFKKGKEWDNISWNKASNLVQDLSIGLKEIGVKKNDKISIIAENSYKWCVIDLAIISLGAITVPGYTTSNEEEIFYLLSHSESSIVFVSSKLLSTI